MHLFAFWDKQKVWFIFEKLKMNGLPLFLTSIKKAILFGLNVWVLTIAEKLNCQQNALTKKQAQIWKNNFLKFAIKRLLLSAAFCVTFLLNNAKIYEFTGFIML